MDSNSTAEVSVIMGSASDWEIMREACLILQEFAVPFEKQIVSAHRSPDLMYEFAQKARQRGIKVIIAGAGGAAHLPGMVASLTTLPVLGVPVPSRHLQGVDSLHSIVQMPGGVPVATLAIGKAGAKNAGLLAVRILATYNTELAASLASYAENMKEQALARNSELTLE
ncbi:MAG: 5-(carboxyamino)imidazole ribonucleotide mutase [Spirochaetota bacterium]